MIVELAVYEKEPNAVLATPQDLHRALFGDSSALYGHVAESDDGTIVGFALWFLNYSTWLGKHGIYLEDLFVRPEYRGRGYGKALLKHLAGICINKGYGRLQWWVLDWNTPAIDFYKSIGAEPMDEWTVFRVSGNALKELSGI